MNLILILYVFLSRLKHRPIYLNSMRNIKHAYSKMHEKIRSTQKWQLYYVYQVERRVCQVLEAKDQQ